MKPLVEATIVKTMKSQTTLSHAELVRIVMEGVVRRGAVTKPFIKGRIDALVDREFLRRVEGQGYEYIA